MFRLAALCVVALLVLSARLAPAAELDYLRAPVLTNTGYWLGVIKVIPGATYLVEDSGDLAVWDPHVTLAPTTNTYLTIHFRPRPKGTAAYFFRIRRLP